VILALAALVASDALDEALPIVDEMLSRGRARGSALTVVTVSSMRAHQYAARRSTGVAGRRRLGDRALSRPPGHRVRGACRDCGRACRSRAEAPPDSLRRLVDRVGVRYDTEFIPNATLRYASGVLRAAAGNHEGAIEELRGCAFEHPAQGGGNPAMFPWRSSAALSLAELGRHDEARALAADEVQRARLRRPARDRHRAACGGNGRPP
jgi:hypothetical protein